jgi:PKD repeat protein
MNESTATVADTTILPDDTTASMADTTVTPSDTAVSGLDTFAAKNAACYETVDPVASFSADPETGGNPLTVQFTDLSAGYITGYLWDFGDGTTSQERNPVHRYKGMGYYEVKLTATGPAGESTVFSSDLFGGITVTEGLPIADFTATPTVGMAPLTVNFVDKSSDKWGPILTYFWEFGDGDTAWGDIAYHAYTNMDQPYTVRLTVTGPGGVDVSEKINFIHSPGFGPLQPVIDDITPGKPQPGDKIKIRGYNFGENQGDSLIYFNNKVYDSSSGRIKRWSDTLIKIKVPYAGKSCSWFKHGGGDYRKRKIRVTVDGNESNEVTIKVYKPDTCP